MASSPSDDSPVEPDPTAGEASPAAGEPDPARGGVIISRSAIWPPRWALRGTGRRPILGRGRAGARIGGAAGSPVELSIGEAGLGEAASGLPVRPPWVAGFVLAQQRMHRWLRRAAGSAPAAHRSAGPFDPAAIDPAIHPAGIGPGQSAGAPLPGRTALDRPAPGQSVRTPIGPRISLPGQPGSARPAGPPPISAVPPLSAVPPRGPEISAGALAHLPVASGGTAAPPDARLNWADAAASAPTGPPRDPREAAQRWQAAVRQRPLETPRPLPAVLLPWAREVSGRSLPRYTAGPATRAALGAAGALGASSGDVVHLQSEPTGASVRPVLAHELAHLRHPLGRTRFLLKGRFGALDADERSARGLAAVRGLAGTAGSAVAAARGAAPGAPGSGGGQPPGGSGAGKPGSGLSRALQVAAPAAAALAQSKSGSGGGASRAAQAAQAVQAATATGGASAGSAGRGATPGSAAAPAGGGGKPAATSAGIVSNLPVGGLGAAAAALTRHSADTKVDEVLGRGRGEADEHLDDAEASATRRVSKALGKLPPGVHQLAELTGHNLEELAGEQIGKLRSKADGLVEEGLGKVESAVDPVIERVSTDIGGLADKAETAIGARLPDAVADQLVEMLEDRILAELERRGGRYQGVF